MSDKNDEVYLDFRAVARGVIYDTGTDDPECHAEYICLSPLTEEGMEMEKKLSDRRLALLEPVSPLLVQHGALLAGVMTSLHYDLPHLDKADLTPEVQDSAGKMMPLYAQVSVVSAATFLAMLLENGIVQMGAKEVTSLGFNREQ